MLEWHLADKKLCALLVVADFVESNSAGAILVGFLVPPVLGAFNQTAFAESCFWGAFPPVDL